MKKLAELKPKQDAFSAQLGFFSCQGAAQAPPEPEPPSGAPSALAHSMAPASLGGAAQRTAVGREHGEEAQRAPGAARRLGGTEKERLQALTEGGRAKTVIALTRRPKERQPAADARQEAKLKAAQGRLEAKRYQVANRWRSSLGRSQSIAENPERVRNRWPFWLVDPGGANERRPAGRLGPDALAATVETYRDGYGRRDGQGVPFIDSWAATSARALLALPRAESLRRRAWAVRDVGRSVNPSARCASCGYVRVGEVGIVRRAAEFGSGWTVASVERCGSPWLCAVCALVTKGKRAAEITAGVELQRRAAGSDSLALVTFTTRHAEGDALAELADGFQRAWVRFWQRVPTEEKQERALLSERYQRERARWRRGGRKGPEPQKPQLFKLSSDLVGSVYGAEVTSGRNGWHYHRHALVAWSREFSPDERAEWQARAFRWWRECVTREMGAAHEPEEERGLRVDELHAEQYLSKLGLEVSDVGAKRGKLGSRNQWALLEDAARGDAEALSLIAEFGAAMKGKKSVQASDRLIAHWKSLGWKHVESDEEIDEAEGGELVLEVPALAWSHLRRSGAELCRALEAPDEPTLVASIRALAPRLAWEPTIDGWGNHARAAAEDERLHALRERQAIRGADDLTRAGSKRARIQRERRLLYETCDREALATAEAIEVASRNGSRGGHQSTDRSELGTA